LTIENTVESVVVSATTVVKELFTFALFAIEMPGKIFIYFFIFSGFFSKFLTTTKFPADRRRNSRDLLAVDRGLQGNNFFKFYNFFFTENEIEIFEVK
jgi:hypothetical protein